jgi:polyisoprenoid-binding protein YceI
MVDNLRSRDVLDAARFPSIDFRGRYAGMLEGGTLAGDLQVKSVVRAISIPVRVQREGSVLAATGAWEGRLTDLGVKPFKALLGAIKLEDWIAVRLDVRFAAP